MLEAIHVLVYSLLIAFVFPVTRKEFLAHRPHTDFFVLPEARRHGYGKQLLLAVAAAGAEKGCDMMHWTTGNENFVAQQVYEMVGAKSVCKWYELELPVKGKGS